MEEIPGQRYLNRSKESLHRKEKFRLTVRVKMPVSSFGYVLGLRKLNGINVCRCRNSYRDSFIETGYSSFFLIELPASIRASSPVTLTWSLGEFSWFMRTRRSVFWQAAVGDSATLGDDFGQIMISQAFRLRTPVRNGFKPFPTELRTRI
jgi:hypothetical protein